MKRNFVKYLIALLLFGSNGIVASRISLTSYEIVFLANDDRQHFTDSFVFYFKEKNNFYSSKTLLQKSTKLQA